MATAKKAPAKTASKPVAAKKPAAKAKVPVKAKNVLVASKTVATAKADEQFRMPLEVKEWIDQASSRMKNMQSKIERLEEENKKLKAYRRWAEQRIVGTSHE